MPPAAVLPQCTIDIARCLDHFVVETPKAGRHFVKMLTPGRALRTISFVELEPRPPPSRVEDLLAPALDGNDIGVLSDAACPGVTDPGAALVAAAHRSNVRVVPLVGPSAILLALMALGMNPSSSPFTATSP